MHLSAGLRSWVYHAAHRHTHSLFLNGTARCHRAESTSRPHTTPLKVGSEKKIAEPGQDPKTEGCFFLDSVFPIRLGSWECVPQFLDIMQRAHSKPSFRHYIALFKEKALIEKLEDIFIEVNVHGFEVSSMDPRLAAPQRPLHPYLFNNMSELKTAESSSTFNISQCPVPSPSAQPNLQRTRLTLLLLK